MSNYMGHGNASLIASWKIQVNNLWADATQLPTNADRVQNTPGQDLNLTDNAEWMSFSLNAQAGSSLTINDGKKLTVLNPAGTASGIGNTLNLGDGSEIEFRGQVLFGSNTTLNGGTLTLNGANAEFNGTFQTYFGSIVLTNAATVRHRFCDVAFGPILIGNGCTWRADRMSALREGGITNNGTLAVQCVHADDVVVIEPTPTGNAITEVLGTFITSGLPTQGGGP